MKKLFLLFTAVILSAFVMSSCIDNEASAGIEAVRNAQAALINAKATLTQADAAVRQADAAYRLAQARYEDAVAEAAELGNDSLAVELEKAQADALTYKKEAEKNLAVAVHALAKYLADQGLADAAAYLSDYNGAVLDVQNTEQQIADLNYNLSILALYLEAWEDYITLDPGADEEEAMEAVGKTLATVKAEAAADLVSAEDDLADAEADLVAITALLADPTTYYAQLAALNSEIADLEDAIAEGAIAMVPLNQALSAAGDVLDDASSDLSDAEDELASIEDVIETYEGYESDLADATADAADALAAATASSADEEAQLAPFIDALEENWTSGDGPLAIEVAGLWQDFLVALNAYKVQIALSDALDDDSDGLGDAQDALDAIIDDIDALTDNASSNATYMGDGSGDYPSDEYDYDGDGALGDTWTGSTVEATDADEIWDDVDDMVSFPDPGSDLGTELSVDLYAAIVPFFQGGEAYDLLESIGRYDVYDDFLADFDEAEGVYADMAETGYENNSYGSNDWTDYSDALAAAADAAAIVDDEDELAAYDEAVAGLAAATAAVTAAETAVDDAQDVYDTAEAAASDLQDTFDAMQDEADDKQELADAIETYLDGGSIDIGDYEDAVTDAEAALEIAQFNVVEADFNEAKAVEMEASQQAYLLTLQAKLAVQQAKVARLLELLTAAIGG